MTPEDEYKKLIRVSEDIQPLGESPFGEQVSLYNGSLSFTQTDVSLAGNGPLLQVSRSFRPKDKKESGTADGGFADWDLEIPRITTLAATQWLVTGSSPRSRCSQFGQPPTIAGKRGGAAWEPTTWWNGYQLVVPGQGSQDLLRRAAQNTLSPSMGGSVFGIVTTHHWMITCGVATDDPVNDPGGEGFLAVAPDGTRYWFTHLVYRWAPTMHRPVGSGPQGLQSIVVQPNLFIDDYLTRRQAAMLVTRIEDRFGNSLVYSYNGAQLTAITASDGRQVTLSYLSGTDRIGTISVTPASGPARTWSYQYSTALTPLLTKVTLPDGSAWSYDLAGLRNGETLIGEGDCDNLGAVSSSTVSGSMVHPSGLSGTFQITPVVRGRSYVPRQCVVTALGSISSYAYNPRTYAAFAITRKTFSGAGVPSRSWSYGYSPANASWSQDCASGCTSTVWTDVVDPDGHATRHTFSNRFDETEGQLQRVDSYSGAVGSSLLRSETSHYATSTTGPWPSVYGTNLQSRMNLAIVQQVAPLDQRTITQDGNTFTWQAQAFNAFTQVTQTARSNNVGPTVLTEQTSYLNDLPHWVLGLPTQTKNLGTNDVVDEYHYDTTKVTLRWRKHFGKTLMNYTFNSAGQLASFTDGNSHTTTLGNYKRGIPQTITFPATADQPTPVTKNVVVNDVGWITSINDENNNKTCYDYDAMGRLTGITWPSEAAADTCNTSTWAKTFLSFAPVTSAEYGIPAGHWKQTTSTGNGRQVTYYDALWRPLVEERYDNANAAATRSVTVKRYDTAGRLAFQSYPMASLGSYASTALPGSKTTYDALDRVTTVVQDSELGVLTTTTAYLSGLKIEVTNPRGNATTTRFMAYDQPTTDWPVAIVHPGGAYTDIARDAYGKPTAVTRRNSDSTLAETRNYAYNAHQELCSQTEPETGTTLMGYDGAGNLAWSAAGLAAGTACSADGSTPAILARKVSRGYDARHRLTTLTFPDSEGNQTWTYAPDGLPTSIVTTMLSDTRTVTNQYAYNRRRLLTIETQQLTGWDTYAVTRQYDANGHLARRVYPASYLGSVVDYAPNALGQPTRAGAFASAVTYHPNGAIRSFTYGNGLTHTLTQNLRGLPDTSCDFASSCDASAVLNDGVDYDANGNVAAISDGRAGYAGDRDMSYDTLDRLTQTVAPGMFGTATYTYDVLDNLTQVKVTGGNQVRDHTYCYDSTWRLTTIRTGSCTGATVMSLGYDVQGNLANRNGVAYTFDHGNRLRQVAGRENQYLYDGHGRRVASNRLVNGSSVRRSIYGLDGKLLFVQDQGEAKRKEYIYLGASLIAERSLPNTGVATPVSIRYQHTDALGSPVAISNESQAVVERTAYEPYGWAVNRAERNGPGYTGHHEDAATGLVYMQQRYYDPLIGRFLSVDPVTAYEKPLTNFCRYCYAANNPYKFVDPDGRRIEYAAGVPKDFKNNFGVAIKYLNAKGAAANFADLQASKTVYIIAPAADRTNGFQTKYSSNSKTITWADKGGVEVKDSKTGKMKVLSPAMALGHEGEHGRNDDNGTFRSDNATKDKQFGTAEEKKVIQGYENKAAGKLGEPIRNDHTGYGKKTCASPEKC
ncbi:RHS repeat domain-containing protein [Rhodanobacter lindaniclasticus]